MAGGGKRPTITGGMEAQGGPQIPPTVEEEVGIGGSKRLKGGGSKRLKIDDRSFYTLTDVIQRIDFFFGDFFPLLHQWEHRNRPLLKRIRDSA